MITFEPSFVDSEDMFYVMFEHDCCIAAATASATTAGVDDDDGSKKRHREDEAAEPVHTLSTSKKPKATVAGIIAAAGTKTKANKP